MLEGKRLRDMIEVTLTVANRRLWPFSRAAGRATAIKNLALIGDCGQMWAVRWIAPLALHDDRAIAEAAALAIAKLEPSVRDLAAYDASARLGMWTSEFGPWAQMHTRELARLAALPGGGAVVRFATCHPNGHVREAAVRHVAGTCVGEELPYLILRSNDWVAQVRAIAQSELGRRLKPENLDAFVAALPLIERMARWGRIGDRWIIIEIEAFLGSADAVPALELGLDSTDAFVRRACVRRLFESTHADSGAVLRSALSDRDSYLRTWASRLVCEADSELFRELVGDLLADRLGSVRRRAALRAIELGLDFPWREMLLDSHGGVRAIAQGAALERDIDPAELYRERLPTLDGRSLVAAILGLGETGTPDDDALIRSHIGHPRVSVRKAVLRSLARLRADDIANLCFSAFSDPNPGVPRTARDLLLGGAGIVVAARLWDAFEASPTIDGRRHALTAFAAVDFWDRIVYLLRATHAREPQVRAWATDRIEQWRHRRRNVFTTPSARAIAAIETELAKARLSEDLKADLAFVLRQ